MIKWILKKLPTADRLTELILDWINGLLSRIHDGEKVAEVADVVAKVAGAVEALVPVLKGEMLRRAVAATVEVIAQLAKAIRDLKVTTDECDALVGAVEDCVVAWKDWADTRGKPAAQEAARDE